MKDKLNFEKGMSELEAIVNKLESGEISLEESFKAYQKGVELYKALKGILDEGDARISLLTSEGEKEFNNNATEE